MTHPPPSPPNSHPSSPSSLPNLKPTPSSPFSTPSQLRESCRTGQFRSTTASHCPDYVQANLIILPNKYAGEFKKFCQRNPVSCPLLGESRGVGDWRVGEGLIKGGGDLRGDAPGYNVYRDGQLVQKDIADIYNLWSSDSVGFLIGCSFSFERALNSAGLTPRHQEMGTIVPMYKTNYPLLPSGIFKGNMVVSMRPYPEHMIERVRDITRPYVHTHGEPVAWGPNAASQLGIKSLLNPEFGDPALIKPGEVPVFWACGVTPQNVIMSSPEVEGLVIGHTPGKMVVLDLRIDDILE